MTAMCSACGKEPVHAKGLGPRCYQAGMWTRCEVCGTLTRSRKGRCPDHPPECQREGCTAPIATPSGKYCVTHGVPRNRKQDHPECEREGCTVKVRIPGRTLCGIHTRRKGAPPRFCDTEGCENVLRGAANKCWACRDGRGPGRKPAAPPKPPKPVKERRLCACGRELRTKRETCWKCHEKANPRVRTSTSSGTKRVRKPKLAALPPLPAWVPEDLKHADTRPPRPVAGGGENLATIAAPDPMPGALVRRLQSWLAPDLLDALGITPGDERIPLLEDEEMAAA